MSLSINPLHLHRPQKDLLFQDEHVGCFAASLDKLMVGSYKFFDHFKVFDHVVTAFHFVSCVCSCLIFRYVSVIYSVIPICLVH